MNCHDAREYFSGWVDGALSTEEHAAIEPHLAQCFDCRRELDRFRETVGLLQRAERPRAPAGFVDRVLDAVRPAPWPRRLYQRLFLPLQVKLPVEAAAVLLVAGLAVYVFQRTPELQQATRQEVSQPAPPSGAPPAPAPAAPLRDARRSPVLKAPAKPQGIAQHEQRGVEPPASQEPAKTAAPATPPPAAAPAPAALPPVSAPAPSPNVEARKETAAEDAPRASEPAPTQPGLTPAVEGRADSAREKALRAPVPTAPQPLAMRVLPPADVVGRLTVKDRGAAERALVELLARFRGAEVSRRDESGATVVDLVIPRGSYAEFAQGLARIGSWLPEGEPAELPTQVRVTLRLSE